MRALLPLLLCWLTIVVACCITVSTAWMHCCCAGAHGHGRSATLMAACFLQAGLASSVDHAVSLMTVRPATIAPNARVCTVP